MAKVKEGRRRSRSSQKVSKRAIVGQNEVLSRAKIKHLTKLQELAQRRKIDCRNFTAYKETVRARQKLRNVREQALLDEDCTNVDLDQYEIVEDLPRRDTAALLTMRGRKSTPAKILLKLLEPNAFLAEANGPRARCAPAYEKRDFIRFLCTRIALQVWPKHVHVHDEWGHCPGMPEMPTKGRAAVALPQHVVQFEDIQVLMKNALCGGHAVAPPAACREYDPERERGAVMDAFPDRDVDLVEVLYAGVDMQSFCNLNLRHCKFFLSRKAMAKVSGRFHMDSDFIIGPLSKMFHSVVSSFPDVVALDETLYEYTADSTDVRVKQSNGHAGVWVSELCMMLEESRLPICLAMYPLHGSSIMDDHDSVQEVMLKLTENLRNGYVLNVSDPQPVVVIDQYYPTMRGLVALEEHKQAPKDSRSSGHPAGFSPGEDLYEYGFPQCDWFNSAVKKRTPRRAVRAREACGISGSAYKIDELTFTAALVNCYHIFQEVHCCMRGIGFESFCAVLIIDLFNLLWQKKLTVAKKKEKNGLSHRVAGRRAGKEEEQEKKAM